ncbi:sugar transferase [Mesorhizobium marinum]|uniref:Sugar transferase n=1 Tax=Mesorhizobium marinum TaxID=3228790 RepID=A0ABV3R0P6_9HYPH
MKRLLDIALALPLGLIALPVVLAAALWVRRTSPGPAFFSQLRVGRNERPFRCLKLRTMHHGTTSLPTHEVGADAVTDAGRVLRRLKLDELPQLWNVLVGEMSLVGPRPCLPIQHELIALRRAFGVTGLRPGITGLAQLRGIDMSDPGKCAGADAEYLRARSLRTDLDILLRTVSGGIAR